MLKRRLEEVIVAALADTPVVLINGARQAGKSTLAAHIYTDQANRVTFDDIS